MRIPLDYYRILGVPIQASNDQLTQAYKDRSLQLPRQEYSQKAIAARKQLLEEAYKVLSQPERRTKYNLQFLARTCQVNNNCEPGLVAPETPEEDLDDPTPWIEIKPELFVGALAILHELGEYELVLRLGGPYSRSLEKNQRGIRADVILAMALSYLELGREQWQENQYQNAAISGQMGLDMLLREQLFPSIREEIQTDLCKLQPYLILELLSQEPITLESKNKGKALLQEMLNERGGIEGNNADRSGLSIDEFLRFIQQIRTYLSSSEQQELFEAEAKRPSAVAAYLALYALLARGFAGKEPAAIVRARDILTDLESRQEVYLEQAVCYLLLGQTERACQVLQQSQELEPLAFIQEHSEGSPDLLPGLCLYAQRWLTTEVFSHFYDLAETQISLDEYFSDPEVQAYLEGLSEEVELQSEPAKAKIKQPQSQQSKLTSAHKNPAKQLKLAYENIRSRLIGQRNDPEVVTEAKPLLVATKNRETPAIVFSPIKFSPLTNLGELTQSSSNGDRGDPGSARFVSTNSQKQTNSAKANSRQSHQNNSNKILISWKQLMSNLNSNFSKRRIRYRHKSSLKIKRLLVLGIPLCFGLGVLGFSYKWSQIDNSSISISPESSESLDSTWESDSAESVFAKHQLNEQKAKKVIKTWLESKSQAFGAERQIDSLNTILADPLLTRQRNAAIYFQGNKAHRMYSHAVQVESVQTNPDNPHVATVEARVREIASHYQNDRYNRASSYDDNLLVRYHLIRQDDRWLIKDINVLE